MQGINIGDVLRVYRQRARSATRRTGNHRHRHQRINERGVIVKRLDGQMFKVGIVSKKCARRTHLID